MKDTRNIFGSAALACLAALSGTSALAATLSFDGPNVDPYVEDGFAVDPARIVNGNCDSLSGRPCLALNDNETSTVTTLDSSAFAVSSFWFQLLGQGTDNTLTVTSSAGGTLSLPVSTYDHNDGGQVFDFTSLSDYGTAWSNLVSLTFSTSEGGNVRIDDLELTGGGVAPVPVPAAGLLLLTAIGGISVLRRRKS